MVTAVPQVHSAPAMKLLNGAEQTKVELEKAIKSLPTGIFDLLIKLLLLLIELVNKLIQIISTLFIVAQLIVLLLEIIKAIIEWIKDIINPEYEGAPLCL
jgi:phage-related protein